MRGTQGAALCRRLANPARGKMCPMLGREGLEAAMRRAFELAERSPIANINPQVGCVILGPTGNIVAGGWHGGAGTPHAEIAALAQLSDEWRNRASELTAVVTLEPCNHTGHTGPCAVAISEARIGTVVYAVSDPGDVSSGGSATLRRAGVEVLGGVLEAEGLKLLAPWIARQQNLGRGSTAPRPRVTVKWAQTLDGRAAAADGSSQWITGPAARLDVHRRRAEADAILVGTGTLLTDDPALTARGEHAADGLLVSAEKQPLPVVLGRREIPADARINEHPALKAHGLTSPLQFSGDNLKAHLEELSTRGVRSLFVEGGPTVASAFLRAGLADEVLIYIAPALLGGPRLAIGDLGIESMAGITRLRIAGVEHLGDDLLIRASLHDQSESKEGSLMFTGLIEEIGLITALEPIGDSLRLTVRGPKVTSDAAHGDSIQVSGVCLTVIGISNNEFSADVMEQTIKMSTLGELQVGDRVNLERAARVDSRLGGHIVQGHVDGTTELLSVTQHDNWRTLRFSLAPDLAPYLVDKGSVTLAGVSLTVSNIAEAQDPQAWFEVSLIPETLTSTVLGALEPGDRVNLETDILARHVARMLQFGTQAESHGGRDDPRPEITQEGANS